MRETVEAWLLARTPLRDRSLRKRMLKIRRRGFEACGSKRYSRPALHDLDAKLSPYLPDRPGLFVEAGANDGWTHSNTYYLERWKGWRGVLIEAIPEFAQACRQERPRSQVFNCALVNRAYPGQTVVMRYAERASVVAGALGGGQREAEHIATFADKASYEIDVPARTLSEVLSEAGVDAIDFMSLDLEGSERVALEGLDLDRWRPRCLLIEALDESAAAEITGMLDGPYSSVGRLTPDDLLFRAN